MLQNILLNLILLFYSLFELCIIFFVYLNHKKIWLKLWGSMKSNIHVWGVNLTWHHALCLVGFTLKCLSGDDGRFISLSVSLWVTTDYISLFLTWRFFFYTFFCSLWFCSNIWWYCDWFLFLFLDILQIYSNVAMNQKHWTLQSKWASTFACVFYTFYVILCYCSGRHGWQKQTSHISWVKLLSNPHFKKNTYKMVILLH